jgi:predicted dehydrogenase
MAVSLKAAVIGAGWYACQNHIPTLATRPEVILDGVCRKGADELERARDHFGFAFASEDHREVLARRPDIVVVASPHDYHYQHARDALEAGAHVLCEKPFTLDPDDAWALVRLARERDRHLLVANGYNYLPRVAELRDRIAGGLLGDIEHIMVSFISVTRDVFLGDRGLDSWQTTFFRPARATWQDPARGGGFAYGQASHSLALMLYLSGLTPETVSAYTFGPEVVDLADAAALKMTNGAVVSVSGAAAMPQGNRGLMRLFMAGSAGVLIAEFDTDRCQFRGNDGTIEDFTLSAGDWVYHCRGPVHALVDLALGKGRNQSPGEIGAYSSAILAGMLASGAKGGTPQPVRGPR